MLSDQELDKLKQALKKKNIKIEDLKDETVMDVYRKYNATLYKNKDMTTFLDAYLYGIGKQLEKRIIGIETYEEQAYLMDNLQEDEQKKILTGLSEAEDPSQNLVDTMIQYYLNQNMQGIYELMHNKSGSNFEDIFLIKRNYVMCRRIDSLIQDVPAFICVGAGHLAGTEGLIRLLQNKGYTVKPLKSPKTAYYKKLIPQNTGLKNWKIVYDAEGGYKVKMPGVPSPVSTMGVELKVYFDFGSGYFYLSTAVPATGNPQLSSDRMAKAMKKRFEEKGKVLSQKTVRSNNLVGYDIETRLDKVGDYMIRVVSDTSRTFILMVCLSNKKPEKNVVKAFFESLEVVERVAPGDIVFKDDTAAFMMVTPAGFKETANEMVRNGNHYKTFLSMDYYINGYITVTYVDYEGGKFIPDVNELFTSVFTAVSDRLGVEQVAQMDTLFNGYEARDYFLTTQEGVFIFMRYILRGTRLYMVSITSKDGTKKEQMKKRLSGFDFISPLRPLVHTYSSKESDFTVLMPAKNVIREVDSTDYTNDIAYEYAASDYFSNNWFKIYSRAFTRYTYLKNDSAILHYFKRQLVAFDDSLVDSSFTVKGNKKYLSLKAIPSGNKKFLKKYRIVLNGRKYYYLSLSVDLNAPNDSLDTALFDSFELTSPDKQFDVSKPKTESLFADLQSKDSLTAMQAFTGFKTYPFKKENLNGLSQLLQKVLYDDSGEQECRFWIYKKICDLTDSSQLAAYIKKEYTHMPEGNTKAMALNELALLKTNESIDLWKDLLLNQRPQKVAEDYLYNCSGEMTYDSVALIKSIYPYFCNPFYLS